jgi:hypothetical protein
MPLSTAKLALATSICCVATYSNAHAVACGVIGWPAFATFTISSWTCGATPTMPKPLSPAAMSPATCVPWPI